MVACVGGPGDDDACRSRRGIVAARNGRCRRRWRRRGRWAPGGEEEVELQTVHQPACLALKLRELRAGVALRAYGSVRAIVAIQGAIYDFEVGRILVQTYLKVEDWWPLYAEGVFPKFDVEDAVGRSSRYGGKYPLPAGGILIVQVLPPWSDQIVHVEAGQASVSEIPIVSTRKLQVAV